MITLKWLIFKGKNSLNQRSTICRPESLVKPRYNKQRIQIEPYWNVNENALFTSIVDDGIQIEPYWNVNEGTPIQATISGVIQIEPYWNVNLLQLQ